VGERRRAQPKRNKRAGGKGKRIVSAIDLPGGAKQITGSEKKGWSAVKKAPRAHLSAQGERKRVDSGGTDLGKSSGGVTKKRDYFPQTCWPGPAAEKFQNAVGGPITRFDRFVLERPDLGFWGKTRLKGVELPKSSGTNGQKKKLGAGGGERKRKG